MAVGEIAETAAELAHLCIYVIQKFRATFILTNAHMSEIGSERGDSIVAYLVNVLVGSQDSWLKLGYGAGLGGLIAGVLESWKPEFIFNPGPKIARAIGCLAGICRLRCVWREPGGIQFAGESHSQCSEQKFPACCFHLPPSSCKHFGRHAIVVGVGLGLRTARVLSGIV